MYTTLPTIGTPVKDKYGNMNVSLTYANGKQTSYGGANAVAEAQKTYANEMIKYNTYAKVKDSPTANWDAFKASGGYGMSSQDMASLLPTQKKKDIYTLDDIKGATLDSLYADRGLAEAFSKMYNGSDYAKLLTTFAHNDYVNNLGSFNSAKQNMLTKGSELGKIPSELERNVDRYVNWNHPDTMDSANAERQKALDFMNKQAEYYKSIGIDYNSIGYVQQYRAQLGDTPGGGQTAVQTAGLTAQQVKDAGGTSFKADGTKTDLATGNVVSKDGKTITIDGNAYVNDPGNQLLKTALEKQQATNQGVSPTTATNNVVSKDGKTITVNGKSYSNDPNNQLLKDALAKQAGSSGSQSAQSYNTKITDDLYSQIVSRKLIPSKENKAWTALYKDGKATPEQAEAYRRWSETSTSAQDLFEQIKSGKLIASKTDPTWASMYKDGKATEAQKQAFAMWENYTKNQVTNYEGIKTVGDANDALNKYQAGLFTGEDYAVDGDGVDTKGYENMSSEDLLKDLIGSSADMPELVSTETKLNELRTQYGLESLESDINSLKAEAEEIEAIKRERAQSQEGKRVSMGVIGGRIGEIERQENERLDSINRRINAKVGEYEAKYNVVNMMMSASQTDYANAMDQYSAKFSQRMSLVSALKGYEDDARSEEEAEKDNARANLQIAVESFAGQDYESLTSTQKSQLEKMAMQADMPTSLLSGLIKQSVKDNIMSQTQRTGADGYNYMDFVMVDKATGQLHVESIKLGEALGDSPTANQLLEAQKDGYSWNGSDWVNGNTLEGIFDLPGGKYGPGVQCGEGYNIITDGPQVGNSYADKFKYVDKSIFATGPSMGNGLALPLTSGGKLTYGHMATVLESSPDFNYANGTGTINTVEWNRAGKGELSFQTYSVADLKKKYGDNWGFTNSTLTPKYQTSINKILESQAVDSKYMDGLVKDYLGGEDVKSIQSRISDKYGKDADYYKTEFEEVIRQSRQFGTDDVDVGNQQSSVMQEKTMNDIMSSPANYESLVQALNGSILNITPVYETSSTGKKTEIGQSAQITGTAIETREAMKKLISTKFGVTLTDGQLTQIYREWYSYVQTAYGDGTRGQTR